MSSGRGGFGGEGITSLGSIEPENLSFSDGLDFSISSIKVIGISDNTGFISSTFGGRFSFRGIGNISQERKSSGTNVDEIR
jgi:hypothetical protein